jgi:hypothetical protein
MEMTEDIIINVPKSWDDAKKDDLAQRLNDIYLPDDYRIFITNKMDTKIVDAETMDKMRG